MVADGEPWSRTSAFVWTARLVSLPQPVAVTAAPADRVLRSEARFVSFALPLAMTVRVRVVDTSTPESG
jgi:hypothetical protein